MNTEANAVARVRIEIPYHLRTLAGTGSEVEVEAAAPVTLRRALDALEARYPMLGGTVRSYETGQRRAFLRFFVCGEDWSNESLDRALPSAVIEGREALLVVGAIAGG
jgi:molybdopterin synthase sulfur carrier subunit